MLDYLVNKGKIQNYGFSVETVDQALECIQKPNTKSIQVIFNIFRQKPAEELFKIAKEKKVAILEKEIKLLLLKATLMLFLFIQRVLLILWLLLVPH